MARQRQGTSTGWLLSALMLYVQAGNRRASRGSPPDNSTEIVRLLREAQRDAQLVYVPRTALPALGAAFVAAHPAGKARLNS